MVNDPEKNRIQEVVSAVTKTALADGKITSEEADILEAIQVNVLIYDQALEDSLEDGIITEEEREILVGIKHQILNEAWDVASISDGVSEDELKMLEILLNKVEEDH